MKGHAVHGRCWHGVTSMVTFRWKHIKATEWQNLTEKSIQCSQMTLSEHVCGNEGVSLSLFSTQSPLPHATTHSTVYSVLWTQWPPASRPLKARLECVSCTILFQAPHSRPHLFNAYILSWGHEVGMWPLDFGSLAPVAITIIAKNFFWPVWEKIKWVFISKVLDGGTKRKKNLDLSHLRKIPLCWDKVQASNSTLDLALAGKTRCS